MESILSSHDVFQHKSRKLSGTNKTKNNFLYVKPKFLFEAPQNICRRDLFPTGKAKEVFLMAHYLQV